jgi:hypothetical protein
MMLLRNRYWERTIETCLEVGNGVERNTPDIDLALGAVTKRTEIGVTANASGSFEQR